MELMLLIIDFNRFEQFEQLRSRVPCHTLARLCDQVTFKGRYRNTVNCRAAQAIDEIRKILSNFFVPLAAVIDEIHLVDCDNEMPNAQQMRDKGMAS